MAIKETTTKAPVKSTKKAENIAEETQKDNELETLRAENASFKSQLEDMQNQLSQFMQFMQMMNKPVTTEVARDIKVISLEVGQLILSTTGRSDGIHYEFDHQFKSLMVPETDLKQIIKAMPRTTENGLFFIADEEFVNKNGLSYVYRNLMDEDTIKDFFVEDYRKAIEAYDHANDAQKEIIVTMVANKMLNNEEVDANILRELQKRTGKNFMEIEPLEVEKEA